MLKLFTSAVLFAVIAATAAIGQTTRMVAGVTKCAAGGGTAKFTITAQYEESPTALGFVVRLPSGWSYVSGEGEPSVKPAVGRTNELEWAYIDVPATSASFSFVLSYPPNTAGEQVFLAEAFVRGRQSTRVRCDPVIVTGAGG